MSKHVVEAQTLLKAHGRIDPAAVHNNCNGYAMSKCPECKATISASINDHEGWCDLSRILCADLARNNASWPATIGTAAGKFVITLEMARRLVPDSDPPPASLAPPSSGRVIAALADRVDEAITPYRDGRVPGQLSHAYVLSSLIAAVTPLIAALRRRTSGPLAALAPLEAPASPITRAEAATAARTALRGCELGAHSGWLIDEMTRMVGHLDAQDAHGDYARHYLGAHMDRVRCRLKAALATALAEERDALLAACEALARLWMLL